MRFVRAGIIPTCLNIGYVCFYFMFYVLFLFSCALLCKLTGPNQCFPGAYLATQYGPKDPAWGTRSESIEPGERTLAGLIPHGGALAQVSMKKIFTSAQR